MTFANPSVLFLLAIPAFFLAAAFVGAARARARLTQLVGSGLETILLPRGAGPLRAACSALAAVGMALAIVALAGPRLGHTVEEMRQKGRDIILAIDVSRSMLAQDIAPDRLTRAKLLGLDFLAHVRSDRIGIVAFAGTAFLQAPLTIDYGAVAATLQELDPEIIPRGGTNIEAAIKEALEAFGKAEGPNRLLVIISDGEELDANAVSAAKAARDEQVRIETVGIGSPEGAIIPIPGTMGEFVRAPSGEIVRSRLDESLLSRVAEAGGGSYRRFQPGSDQARQILNEAFAALSEREGGSSTQMRPIERFQWPLAAALILLVAAWLLPERLNPKSGLVASAAFKAFSLAAVLLLFACPAHADDPSPEALYEAGKYKEAAEAWAALGSGGTEGFTAAYNRGCALYRAGRFLEAAEAFAKALPTGDRSVQLASHYNLGNSLFRQAEQRATSVGGGKPDLDGAIKSLKDAIEQYSSVTAIDPGHKEAIHNREIAERRLRELEELKRQEEQQKQEREKDQSKEGQKNENQKEQQPDRQNQEEGEKDSKQKEDQQNEENEQPSDPVNEGGEDANNQKPGDARGQEQGEGERDPTENKQPSDSSAPQHSQDQADARLDAGNPAGSDSSDSPGNVPDIQRDGPLEGEIRAADDRGDNGEGLADPAGEREAEESGDGKISRAQAMRLLDALRSEEERVQLRDRSRPERAYRDW